MAEIERIFAQMGDADGGVFRLTLVVEDTQSTVDPRGRPSYTVVAVRVSNTSIQKGEAVWQSNNGQWNNNLVQPGENMESRIAPARQEYSHVWALSARASWG